MLVALPTPKCTFWGTFEAGFTLFAHRFVIPLAKLRIIGKRAMRNLRFNAKKIAVSCSP